MYIKTVKVPVTFTVRSTDVCQELTEQQALEAAANAVDHLRLDVSDVNNSYYDGATHCDVWLGE